MTTSQTDPNSPSPSPQSTSDGAHARPYVPQGNTTFEGELDTLSPPQTEHLLLLERAGAAHSSYESFVGSLGYVTHVASSPETALDAFRNFPIRVVLCDLTLLEADISGPVAQMLALRPSAAIVLLSADCTDEFAARAMQAGAIDCLAKPIDRERLRKAIETARQNSLQAEQDSPEHAPAPPMGDFIGNSPRMQAVYEQALAAARSGAPIYIWGESGTGKELCAQAIHANGPRSDGPFVTLDCGSLPPDRLDSELFGHHRGAFPGALHDKPGALVAANGGTLLLDNLCELAPAAQIKLLRFLQSGQVKSFGAPEPIPTDVRIISASAASPVEILESGRLREDLYYRLLVLSLEMPPLRTRREDIGPIAHMALKRFSAEEERSFTEIDDAALDRLERFGWPGNVRQLMNVIRAAMVMHEGPVLRAEMLPEPDRTAYPGVGQAEVTHGAPADAFAGRTLAEIERAAIEAAIDRHDGSIPRAAQELGVAPSTIYRKREAWLSED